MKNTKQLILRIGCIIGIAIGIFGWVQGLIGNPNATHLTEFTSWGLYIALFLFFEALCAGTLFLAAVGGQELPRTSLAVAGVVFGICTGLSILPDVGSPLTMWRLFLAPNLSSPILLDVWLLTVLIVFSILFIYGMKKSKDGLAKISSYVMGIVSILLPVGTSWVFTSMTGKIGWDSPLEIAIFLLQAVLGGFCVLLFVLNPKKEQRSVLGKVVLGLLIANFVLILGEVILGLYRVDVGMQPIRALLTGTYAPLFWSQVIVGILVPAVMLKLQKAPSAAAGIAILGILLSKDVFIIKGNIYPYLNLGDGTQIPSLSPAVNAFQAAPIYFPSNFEWMVAGGVCALAVLLLDVLLPMFDSSVKTKQLTDKKKTVGETM